jgi:hypothetical protein
MNLLENKRVGSWMGIAFVVLFVGGFLAFPTPMDNDDAAEWEAWWTDSGHRVGAIIGAYLMVLGLIALVWFAWNLRSRVLGSGLMVTFASLFVGVTFVGMMVRSSIAGSKQFGDTPVPAGEFARQFDQIGFGLLLVPGALCAGAFVALASYFARQRTILPGWLTTAGYVVAVLQLAGSLFFPFVLFPLWVLVVSIVMLSRGSGVETSVVAA